MEKVVKGKITKITNFGAFVTVDNGRYGLIHISEISNSYVKDIHDFLKEEQEVQVLVISEDENGRLSLSLKRVTGNKQQSFQTPPDDYYSKPKNEDRSFEEMMNRFKSVSDEKIGDLKKGFDGKRSKNKHQKH